MEPYTPDTKELLENRIKFLNCENIGYDTKKKENEIEIKRLQGVYDEKYPQPYEYIILIRGIRGLIKPNFGLQ